jgi:transcriptional regulator with XRE-family HTH domain
MVGTMERVRTRGLRPLRGADGVPARLSIIVGENLRHFRRKHGLSLEQLAHVSGVSRAMLGQIETGKSAPTINLLGRIAGALKVSVSSLISSPGATGTIIVPRDRSTVLTFSDGGLTCRALFPWSDRQSVEVYEVVLAPYHSAEIAAHAPGSRKTLVVISGDVEVTVADESPARVAQGDAILFNADAAHRFRNIGGSEAKAFLVVSGIDSNVSHL